MALETATHINDLVVANPTGLDDIGQGDDHLRMIKDVLKRDIPLTTPSTTLGMSVLTAASQAAAQSALGVYSTSQTDSAVAGAGGLKSIDYTLAGNALTLKFDPSTLSFRSTTLTSGAPTSVSNIAQINLTIPSGATLGAISGQQSDIVEIAINNAGTMELAVVNLAGGVNLDETGLISTTALSVSSNSANVIYSTTARTNVAYRVVGIFRSTQTTAGTWAQTPALVQGVGGQALAAMSSTGYGQTWQDVTGSRTSGTTYYNTTGKPIHIAVRVTASGSAIASTAVVNGLSMLQSYISASEYSVQTHIIPINGSYSVNNGGSGSISTWYELR